MDVKVGNDIVIDRIRQVINELKSQKKFKSQANIAKKMGITPQQLTEVLSGRNKLTPQIVLKFCMATEVSYEFIVHGKYPVYDVDDKNRLLSQIIFTGNMNSSVHAEECFINKEDQAFAEKRDEDSLMAMIKTISNQQELMKEAMTQTREAMDQTSRLIRLIENMRGIDCLDDRISPPLQNADQNL